MNLKRIFAILGVILLVCLYVSTLVLALIGSPFSRQCLMAAIYCTMIVPILIYAYNRFLHFRNKKKENT